MKLNFLVNVFYKALLLLSAKPNYLSTASDRSTGDLTFQNNFQWVQNHLNDSLDIEIKHIDTRDDSDSCLYNPNISPYIQSLFEYNSLLNAYKHLGCDARENSTNLFLTDAPDTLMEDIEQLEINKTCLYRPLSQTMLPEDLLSYTVNDSSDIQFYLQQDLLALRSAYSLNYHQACKPKEVAESVANRTFPLTLNEANFPTCDSLPIIKEHLAIISSQMLSYSIKKLSSRLALLHPIYILTLQGIDQLPYQLARQSILQCRIDNIDYIVPGRLGMQFLLHELSSKVIDGWFGTPYVIDTNCSMLSVSDSASFVSSIIHFPSIIDELKKIITMSTLNETSYRNCGNTNYELFNLGLDSEKKIPPDTTIILCCNQDHFKSHSCFKLPYNYRFLVTKFVDIYRKTYLSQCIRTVDTTKTTQAEHTSRRVSRSLDKREKMSQRRHKKGNCEKHPLVTASVKKTKDKINLDLLPDLEKLKLTPNDTDLCLQLRNRMLSHIYREEISFDFELAKNPTVSNEKCFFNGKRRRVKPGLKLTYHQKIRKFVKRRNTEICSISSDSNIIFTHSREEGKICVKLGLSYLKDHFTLMARRMLNSDSDFKEDISEELERLGRSHTSSTKVPLDLFFAYLSKKDLAELEQDIAGPAFTLESDNRIKRACVNYLLGVLYYKKAEMEQHNKAVNPELAIDYAKKAIDFFKSHAELLTNLGKFSEYEQNLYKIQRNMYKKLGNTTEEHRYNLLMDNFSQSLGSCRFQRAVATSSFSDLETEYIVEATDSMDNSTICTNKTLEEYTYELSLIDSEENLAFKQSVLFAENCNQRKAFESLDLAYKNGKGPSFKRQFSNTCPHTASSNTSSFFKRKVIEEIDSNMCSINNSFET